MAAGPKRLDPGKMGAMLFVSMWVASMYSASSPAASSYVTVHVRVVMSRFSVLMMADGSKIYEVESNTTSIRPLLAQKMITNCIPARCGKKLLRPDELRTVLLKVKLRVGRPVPSSKVFVVPSTSVCRWKLSVALAGCVSATMSDAATKMVLHISTVLGSCSVFDASSGCSTRF